MNLTPELDRARHQIEAYAREFGLDFYDVVFELQGWPRKRWIM